MSELERKLKNGSMNRREMLSFLGKATGTIAGIGLGMKCSNPISPDPPEPDKYYNITTYIKNILTGKNLQEGRVTLNGEPKTNGSTYSVKNGIIDTIDIDQTKGFIQGYIAGKDPTNKKHIIKDKKGHHQITIARETDLYLLLIPSDFDTELLAKCVGDSVGGAGGESIGNGIIQNYNKKNIPFGVYPRNAIPTATSYDIIRQVRKRINQGANNPDLGQIIYLENYTDVANDVSNGFTARIDIYGGGHSETMNGNIIGKSYALLYVNAANIGLYLRETFQAVSGIRLDAGKPAMPYINVFQPFNYINDGERAMQLANLLPPGFHLNPDSTPTTVQARIYKTTNRNPDMIYPDDQDYPKDYNENSMNRFFNMGGSRHKNYNQRQPIQRNNNRRGSGRNSKDIKK